MKQRYTSRLHELVKSILRNLPSGTQADETLFVEQFYQKTPLSDIESMADGYASLLAQSAYRFYQQRPKNTPKTRVFVPKKTEHGYDHSRVTVQLINDDKPFLVDSLTAELNALGFTIFTTFHPILSAIRDAKGNLQRIVVGDEPPEPASQESFIHFEISALPDDMPPEVLITKLELVLDYVSLAVNDWQMIVNKAEIAKQSLLTASGFNAKDMKEAEDFLEWLTHKNYVFLGYASIDFHSGNPVMQASLDPSSFLGVSKIDAIPQEINTSVQLVDVRKAARPSMVHRRTLMDVVTVKRFDPVGKVIGEHRFYGLFTSSAYYQSASDIPLVRQKISTLFEKSGFNLVSHNGKALSAIVQFMPRDELFQINDDDLFDLSMGILALELRPGVKLFARLDVARRYISALVYVPRELFSTNVRKQITCMLESSFYAVHETYHTEIGESPLARLNLVLRATPQTPSQLDTAKLEQDIATNIMLWADKLRTAMNQKFGEQAAERLFRAYSNAFEDAYTAHYTIENSIYDIQKMEACLSHGSLELELYQQKNEDAQTLHLKIYNVEEDIALSDILPKLERMGLRVIDEFPYVIRPQGQKCLRMRDIRMQLVGVEQFSLAQVKPNFEQLLLDVWNDKIENDRFNALVFLCAMNTRQIELLRAYAKYLRQINFAYSFNAIGNALRAHPDLARLLVQLFEAKFDVQDAQRSAKAELLSQKILQGLSQVSSLQEDAIISTMHKLILATLRTNYFVRNADAYPQILSFKFNSALVPNVPLPKPYAEIYVYSARVEGIHLRGGKVARGGLRWSDRHEDFRTEVLGLMKAQMVKNAVIVPVGSKGGFVVKQVASTDRDRYRLEGVECYKLYLQGLLDLTDNIVGGTVVQPKQVVCYDEHDPYLVVAADKGTASFSDIANGVSQSYGFWLDDAFASGGSVGYDHKKMAITARGAWVSVTRHFREMGVPIDTQNFTVVGIGDMAGDVFGNGMLLSKNIQLVAAFNHIHIFLDPKPDALKTFAERQRLFDLPRSTWADFDKSLLSAGGGIFERSAKTTSLSPEIRATLGTSLEQCSPDELIKIILKAPVDLLWNGGIGTYVKAEMESHEEVGDRANNALRINGKELRAKVVGEGGNLGFTQRGRIEYALCGGRINTDAIDNSAGVDCSDHEVNIKIALQGAVAKGSMSLDARNTLLTSMTDDVAYLVLRDNTLQTQAISVEHQYAQSRLANHAQLIRALEARGLLNRDIEFLPNDIALEDMRERGQGLRRPELAVLLAYSKIALFSDIITSTLPDEPYFASDLLRYFPNGMKEHFVSEINNHSLKREIIATVATNSLVNRAGISFYVDIAEDTKLPARDIVAAYTLNRDIFGLRQLWDHMEQLSATISAEMQGNMHATIAILLKHTTFWMLRHKRLPIDIEQTKAELLDAVTEGSKQLPDMLTPVQSALMDAEVQRFSMLPSGVAQAFAALPWMHGVLDICTIAGELKHSVHDIGRGYFALAELLQFAELLKKAETIVTPSRWDRLALQSLVHELYDEHARLTRTLFMHNQGNVNDWAKENQAALQRVQQMMGDMLKRDALSTPMLMVALQQIKQLGA